MKTAISVPDETFERASQAAADLGMSRSELFSRAAERYLDELQTQSLTTDIDAALAHIDGVDESQVDAVSAGHRVLEASDDEW